MNMGFKQSSHSFYNIMYSHRKFFSLYFIIYIGILFFTSYQLILDGDRLQYQCYSTGFWYGTSYLQEHKLLYPYCFKVLSFGRMKQFTFFPMEYPFLSLIPFSIPLFAPPSFYVSTFSVTMFFTGIFLYWFLQKVKSMKAASAFLIYMLLGQYYLVLNVFDIVPSFLALISIILAEKKKYSLSYILLSIAIFFKIYPVLFALPIIIQEQQHLMPGTKIWQKIQGSTLFISSCSILLFTSIMFNTQGTINIVTYFLKRTIEFESLQATCMWLLHLAGMPITFSEKFGSEDVIFNTHTINTSGFQFYSISMQILPILFFLIFITGAFLILRLQILSRITLMQTCIALLLLLLCTSKIISPQYLLWLTPLLAYEKEMQIKWVIFWGAIVLITFIFFPFIYLYVRLYIHQLTPLPFIVLLIRNCLLVAFTWFYIQKSRQK